MKNRIAGIRLIAYVFKISKIFTVGNASRNISLFLETFPVFRIQVGFVFA